MSGTAETMSQSSRVWIISFSQQLSINALLFSFTPASGDVLSAQEREHDAVFNYVWNARK